MLLLLLSFSVVCQAEAVTRRFIFELGQDTASLKQDFSIKHDRPELPVNPSDIAVTNGYAESDSPPDDKRHRSYSYRVKTTFVESISWQLLYAADLLVAYELILTTKGVPLYSWLPLEAFIVIGWLIKSYWNPDSLLLNPIEQQEVRPDHPFRTITMMFGTGQNPEKYPPSESSSQPATQANVHLTGYFTSLLYSDSGGGNGGPQEHSHTLGLNCFVHPCRGVCRYQLSSDSREFAESPLNSMEHSAGSTGRLSDDVPMPSYFPVNSNDWFIASVLLNLGGHCLQEERRISSTQSHFTPPMETSETQQTTGSSQSGQYPLRISRTGRLKTADQSSRRACEVIIVGEDGRQRPCKKVCKNARALSSHKTSYHSGQQTCKETLVAEDGQRRPCRKICKHAQALLVHKKREHSVQQICKVKVVAEDRQQRPCGKVCKNTAALSIHKSNYHTGQKTCDVPVVAKDGQQRLCGKVCQHAQALSTHKKKDHSGQRTCVVTVAGEDGQQRPCGKVCKNTLALSLHKRRDHSEPKTCDVPVVGWDGQQRRCGKVFENAHTLSVHKVLHRKRKPVDVNQYDDSVPKKVN
ncbi:hypothetical protein [Endozoicomonas sp. 8E]|uniref:hypothetical protein n=1 Tax=Endozoicomonas sp. 8E TaxID=3035692 RepID=UPI0029393337|nr:hypothetical protein [Endozoicomonas sp. 8E]WOG29008.1 hypothetical protein P6910_04915 [Endozoicomonas sp. 8E]